VRRLRPDYYANITSPVFWTLIITSWPLATLIWARADTGNTGEYMYFCSDLKILVDRLAASLACSRLRTVNRIGGKNRQAILTHGFRPLRQLDRLRGPTEAWL